MRVVFRAVSVPRNENAMRFEVEVDGTHLAWAPTVGYGLDIAMAALPWVLASKGIGGYVEVEFEVPDASLLVTTHNPWNLTDTMPVVWKQRILSRLEEGT